MRKSLLHLVAILLMGAATILTPTGALLGLSWIIAKIFGASLIGGVFVVLMAGLVLAMLGLVGSIMGLALSDNPRFNQFMKRFE